MSKTKESSIYDDNRKVYSAIYNIEMMLLDFVDYSDVEVQDLVKSLYESLQKIQKKLGGKYEKFN